MPKVSILVPIYNVEKYLRECLDSLINQTLTDIEIICINDGSTDSSPKIIEEYAAKDERIKVINKPNSGYGASMNMGLDAVTGEYIGILESDDFAKTNMFEDLYKMAKENDLDFVKSDFYKYTTHNNQSRQAGFIAKKYVGNVLSLKDNPFFIKMQPSIWSAIYKKSFLAENNIRFLETPGASYQDASFAVKTFLAAKRFMLTNNAYVYYRQDNINSSCNSRGKVYVICDEWEEIVRYVNERPEIKEFTYDIILSTQFNAYRWNVCRITENFRDEFIEKYQQTFKKYVDNNEIGKDFYIKAKKKELDLLLSDTKKYRKYIDKKALQQENHANKQKLFSIRINSSRISIVLFGKTIVERVL